MTRTTATELARGSELAGYRIEALLGRGGMGLVYLAEQLRLKRKVALKLVLPELARDERFRERLLTESELAASIDHPSVLPIYDTGEADGHLYVAMRYVEGTDLARLLKDEAPLAPERAVEICAQVAAALDAAHQRGLVHRDVKPANVLISSDGHVYLADFGLTRSAATPGLLERSHFAGSADYVAPEQAEGLAIDGEADVYSLACVLFECLTGQPPFARDSQMATLWAHLDETPPEASSVNPDLPRKIDEVLARGLAKTPDERQPSCRSLVADARGALGILERPRPSRLRAPLLVGAVGLALLAGSLAGYFALRGGGEPAARTDTLVRIDPAKNAVVSSTAVGPRASSVTVDDDDFLWVTSYDDRTLVRIDPASGATRSTAIATGTPLDVAVRNGVAAVVSGPFETGLDRVDARAGTVLQTIPLPGAGYAPMPVAAGPAGIWVASSDFGGTGRVSEAPAVAGGSATPLEQVQIPVDPDFVFYSTPDSGSYTDVAVGEGAVWLARDTGPLLKRIDPVSKQVVATIELPFRPKGLAVGEGAVWITALFDDVVARLDPATNEITLTVPVGRGSDGVAVGEGSVWVASTIDGTVTRIDPDTGDVLAVIDVGPRPEDVAVGAGGVWVTTHTA